MKPFFSIIVPVYNDAVNLNTLLMSIFENTFSGFEVIVVDDASCDPAVEEVARSHAVRYFRHGTNRCAAAARNTGAKHATGTVLLFFDSDVVVKRDTLARFRNKYRKEETLFFQALTSPEAANSGFGPDLLALQWHFETLTTPALTLYSLCFSIRRSLFFKLGGFDECFKGLGAEEFEFAFRLEKRTPIHTDRTLLVKHNFQKVFPRALSLLTRTTRFTLLLLLRTRRFDNQVGRPLEGIGALLSLGSLVVFAVALFWKLPAGSLILFHYSLLFFILFVLTRKALLLFLFRTKGLFFALRAVFALALWACASGIGILAGAVTLIWVTLLSDGYMAPKIPLKPAEKGE